jgi:hypothetical protein
MCRDIPSQRSKSREERKNMVHGSHTETHHWSIKYEVKKKTKHFLILK